MAYYLFSFLSRFLKEKRDTPYLLFFRIMTAIIGFVIKIVGFFTAGGQSLFWLMIFIIVTTVIWQSVISLIKHLATKTNPKNKKGHAN
jgi:fatty acid desaturase